MRRVLALSALLIGFAITPAIAQPVHQEYAQPQGWHGVLSASDQSQFDTYYQKWIDATRRNDQDDISNNARKMQDIMTRYNVPSSVPFDQVASSTAPVYPGAAPAAGWQGRLSADDQKDFDKAYSKWVNATRKNDQDDISSSARKMQEIMARYSIPPNVPFSAVASGGSVAAYPAAPVYSYTQAPHLSNDDQKAFDHAYKEWVKARHKNHKGEMDENEAKMRDIMARNNIPANVPYDQIASPGTAYK